MVKCGKKLWQKIEREKKDVKRFGKKSKLIPMDKAYVKGEYDGLNRAQYLLEQDMNKEKKTKKRRYSDDIW